MMKFACFAFVMVGCLWASALDREAFTFTKYDLNVRVEPEQQRLGVRGKISLRNDSAVPQRSLSLQISSTLNWTSIQFEGQPVEFVSQIYTSDIDHTGALSEAIVVLPQPVAPKQTIALDVGYEGVIPQDTTRLTRTGVPEDQAKHAEWDQISRAFTAVRGVGYVAWYPVATDSVSASDGVALPDAVARWKWREAKTEMLIAFAYSGSGEGSKFLCNGLKTPVISERMDTAFQDHVQCNFGQLSTESPLVVIGNFELLDRPIAKIFSLSGHKAGADDFASAIDEVTPLATKWFGDHRDGTETKTEVVDLPDPQAASYESGTMLLMPLIGSDTKLLLAAAQGITNLLFPSPRIWIRDGLADYAQVRLIEEKEGRAAAIAYLKAHSGALLDLEKQSSEGKSDSTLLNTPDQFRVGIKAIYVWWMLRDMVGENALYAALHNYKATEDTDPKYMQKLIEAQAHRDLQWFFDDWVYHDRGLPHFRVASVYPSKLASGGYMVTVTVENAGNAGAEITVTLHAQDSEASGKLVVAGKSKASIRIQSPSLPQDVTLNDGSVPESDTSSDVYKLNQ
jgi:hypothetical protein